MTIPSALDTIQKKIAAKYPLHIDSAFCEQRRVAIKDTPCVNCESAQGCRRLALATRIYRQTTDALSRAPKPKDVTKEKLRETLEFMLVAADLIDEIINGDEELLESIEETALKADIIAHILGKGGDDDKR